MFAGMKGDWYGKQVENTHLVGVNFILGGCQVALAFL